MDITTATRIAETREGDDEMSGSCASDELPRGFRIRGRTTMSTVIKGGTVVTADMTYQADVLIEGEKIAAIGKDLKGDKVLDASGCYVMPGGIDPHTHLEMPFMGTTAFEDFSSGTRAALSGGTTMVVDFVLPGNRQSLVDALQAWHQKAGKATVGLLLPHGDHLVGRAGLEGDARGRQARRQHLQACSWPTRAR